MNEIPYQSIYKSRPTSSTQSNV